MRTTHATKESTPPPLSERPRPDLTSVRTLMDAISGKWDLTVLVELWPQSRGHAELGRATGVERKQLTRVLRRLEESGLIDRVVSTDRPPVRVHYGLTARGRHLLRTVDELARWWTAPAQDAASASTPRPRRTIP